MKLYWIDIETSGLLPERDAILEISYAEANLEQPFNIGPVQGVVLRFSADHHPHDIHPTVLEMHERNGLFADCARSTTIVAEVEEQLLALVPEVTDRENMPTLAR